jgi:tetratricopeptide (TPR) repeat protein
MSNGNGQAHAKVDQLKEVAVYLREADALVKSGRYSEALDEIQKARTRNPKNLYALAYEERVRSILAAQNGKKSNVPHPSEELDKISNRAIAEAQRNADVAARRQKRLEQIRHEEEENRKREEQHRTAIRKKVYDLLLKAREYHANREYNRALDEITRIHMIDPSNENAQELENRIRQDQDLAARAAEAERRKRREEEEQRRKEYLKKELERIKREEEQQRQKEEEARLKAQQQKVKQHIKRAYALFEADQLEDALAELSFVVVIDPLNEEVISLEQNIREREEEIQAAELEQYEKQKRSWSKVQEETREKIQKHLESARSLASQHKYSDALRVISSAYVLDPLNADLQRGEEEVVRLRDRYMRGQEEKQRKEEEARQKKQEEEMKQLLQNAKKRAAADKGAHSEAKQRENNEKIQSYLANARDYVHKREYENALGEIAMAFIIDPFDERVSAAEEEIIREQNKRRTLKEGVGELTQSETKQVKKEKAEVTPTVPPPRVRRQENAADTKTADVERYIEEAKRYRDQQNFHKARNSLTKAFMLDPVNEEIKKLEEEIQRAVQVREEEEKLQKTLRVHINRAKQYLAQENFAQALEEIGSGLKLDQTHDELLSLKRTIGEAKKRWEEVEEQWDQSVVADHRSGKNGRADTKNKYKEALANYYAQRDEQTPDAATQQKRPVAKAGNTPNTTAQTVKSKETESIDLEEEIRKVYDTWRQEQAEIERAERESAIQKHIRKAQELLKKEQYDDALAEIAYARMIQDDRRDLTDLENMIWDTWNKNMKIETGTTGERRGEASNITNEERTISLRIHLRAAEQYWKKQEFGKALDEITKAYLVDPLHPDIPELENRIRRQQEKGNAGNQTLTLVYPQSKAASGF